MSKQAILFGPIQNSTSSNRMYSRTCRTAHNHIPAPGIWYEKRRRIPCNSILNVDESHYFIHISISIIISKSLFNMLPDCRMSASACVVGCMWWSFFCSFSPVRCVTMDWMHRTCASAHCVQFEERIDMNSIRSIICSNFFFFLFVKILTKCK